MNAKGMLYSDIEVLEEKLQSLKLKIGQEEFEAISKQIAEIKKLGMDLPDAGYIASINRVITRIVGLEQDNFKEKDVKEATKEIKRDGFLARLEYIKLCIKNGRETSSVIAGAREYWESIKGNYDKFEAAEVERKLDEVTLEEKLRKIQASKEVDLTAVSGSNYFLVRERLQEILTNEGTDKETQLLVTSWLGESIDNETGKIDVKAMERLMADKKVWEVLAGVKKVAVKSPEEKEVVKTEEETKALVPGEESEARKQQIREICEKYGISPKKIKFNKKKSEERVLITRKMILGKAFYKVTSRKPQFLDTIPSEVVAVIFNNNVTEIDEHFISESIKDIVLPDRVEVIGEEAFAHCAGLTEIRLPETLIEIRDEAFFCSGLRNVELPDSVRKVGRLAFAGPSGDTRIGLTEVKLNYGLEEIGSEAFERNKLKTIERPETVREIGRTG